VSVSKSALWNSASRLATAEKWRARLAGRRNPVTDALLEYADPRPGMRVIDLACGLGEPAIPLAQRIGPKGSVTAVDQSMELLSVAAERAREKGVRNVTTQLADAHTLPFADHYFDLATCRYGVMFFRDVQRALTELRRVLKPDARACFVVWGPIEQPYWQSTVLLVQRHVGGDALEPGGDDPFRFAAPGSLAKVLRDSGFRDIEEVPRNLPWVWPGTGEEVFDYACAMSAPFRSMMERVSPEAWPAIRTEGAATIERYRVGDEIVFGADVILASGKA